VRTASTISLVIAVLLVGCQESGTELALDSDDILDRPARIVEAEVGDSLAGLEVAAVRGANPSPEQVAAASVLVRFPVRAGDTVLAVVRAESSDVDPFAVLRDGEGTISLSADMQVILPALDEDDVALVATSPEDGELFLFVTGGEYMQTSGTLGVELLPLPSSIGFDTSLTSGAARAYLDEMRRLDAELAPMIEDGWALEGEDGWVLENNEFDIPLRDRARARQVIGAVNDIRELLFDELAVIHDTSSAAIGASLAILWQAAAGL
jgi:hypothetical protein